jgi:hypothetical protein
MANADIARCETQFLFTPFHQYTAWVYWLDFQGKPLQNGGFVPEARFRIEGYETGFGFF